MKRKEVNCACIRLMNVKFTANMKICNFTNFNSWKQNQYNHHLDHAGTLFFRVCCFLNTQAQYNLFT